MGLEARASAITHDNHDSCLAGVLACSVLCRSDRAPAAAAIRTLKRGESQLEVALCRWIHKKLLFGHRTEVKDILEDGCLEVDGDAGVTRFCYGDFPEPLELKDSGNFLAGGRRWVLHSHHLHPGLNGSLSALCLSFPVCFLLSTQEKKVAFKNACCPLSSQKILNTKTI